MFAADRACVNTLAQANDLCDELGEGVGVASTLSPLVGSEPGQRDRARRQEHPRLPRQRLAGADQRSLLDRGMMGDGVIDLRAIRALVERAGYRGHCEVEILSAKELVDARPRRGAARLHRAAPDGGVMDFVPRTRSAPLPVSFLQWEREPTELADRSY
jgi:sugar phosphate isomerase/epimerase